MTELLGAGEVLLTGPDVLRVRDALATALRAGRRDGVAPPASTLHLAALVEEAARRVRVATSGNVVTASGAPLPLSVSQDLVGATEVARMLGCKARNVRHMRQLGAFDTARLVGGRWMFERAEVVEIVESRAS